MVIGSSTSTSLLSSNNSSLLNDNGRVTTKASSTSLALVAAVDESSISPCPSIKPCSSIESSGQPLLHDKQHCSSTLKDASNNLNQMENVEDGWGEDVDDVDDFLARKRDFRGSKHDKTPAWAISSSKLPSPSRRRRRNGKRIQGRKTRLHNNNGTDTFASSHGGMDPLDHAQNLQEGNRLSSTSYGEFNRPQQSIVMKSQAAHPDEEHVAKRQRLSSSPENHDDSLVETGLSASTSLLSSASVTSDDISDPTLPTMPTLFC